MAAPITKRCKHNYEYTMIRIEYKGFENWCNFKQVCDALNIKNPSEVLETIDPSLVMNTSNGPMIPCFIVGDLRRDYKYDCYVSNYRSQKSEKAFAFMKDKGEDHYTCSDIRTSLNAYANQKKLANL